MAPDAEGVHSNLKAIQDMEAVCARLADALVERLPEVERELRQTTEALEDRCTNLRREIADLNEQISGADDGGGVSLEKQRLEEAEDQLASAQRRTRRLEGISTDYARQARKVEHLANSHLIKAREFLKSAAEDLKAYLVKDVSEVTWDSQIQLARGPSRQNDKESNKIPCQPQGSNSDSQKAWADTYLHPDNLALTCEEREALAGYQKRDFKVINHALRRGYVLPDKLKSQVAAIDAAIQRSIAPVDMVVFRGTDDIIGEQARVGRISDKDKGFFSTSLSHYSARKGFEAGTLLQIIVPKGANALYMDELHKPHGHELEILLSRGTRFLVTSKCYVDNVYWVRAIIKT